MSNNSKIQCSIDIAAFAQGRTDVDALTKMNEFFCSVGDYVSPSSHCVCTKTPLLARTKLANSIILSPVTAEEIANFISRIRNNVAAGLDGLSAVPIKHVASIIALPLTFIINQMLETGIFPSDLKLARITPVHKGGAVSDITNYRPISVLPILSKVFENVINTRLKSFFTKYRIVNDSQYGFQKGKSTEMALLLIKDEIVSNIENRLFTVGLFIYLRRAFDCVNHNILLSKLHDYGIRGVAHDLINNYLYNRKLCVIVGDLSSPTTAVKHEVPQGLILGPSLFIL